MQKENRSLQMTQSQQFSLLMGGLGDLTSAFGSYYQGQMQASDYNFQADMNRVNADLLRQDIQSVIMQGYDEENAIREQGFKQKGQQQVAMGSSGFSVDSDAYKQIINETDYNIARNTAAIRTQMQYKTSALETQAKLTEIQADIYDETADIIKDRATTSAIAQGITGIAKVGTGGFF